MKRSLKEMRTLLDAAFPKLTDCREYPDSFNSKPPLDFFAAAPSMVADLLDTVQELRDALGKSCLCEDSEPEGLVYGCDACTCLAELEWAEDGK